MKNTPSKEVRQLRKALKNTEALLTLTEAALKACNEERIKALEDVGNLKLYLYLLESK